MLENRSSSLASLNREDCHKAASVLKRWKTLFLLVVAICLLLQQASFYLVDQGYIKINGQVNGQVNGNEPAAADQAEEANPVLQFVARWLPADSISKITFGRLAWTINLANTVLILAAVLYCLTLLLSLNLSMYGRLGGIKHIARAFILSLLMLVLLLPWQKILGGVVTGAVFTPQEMVKWYSSKTEDMLDIVLYYLRFGGYGLSIFLLLILSDLGSLLWARAILRRIKIAEAKIDWGSAHQQASSTESSGIVVLYDEPGRQKH